MTPDLLNPDVRPEPGTCYSKDKPSCGRPLPYNWGYAGMKPNGRREERWLPTRSPCPNCTGVAELQAQQSLRMKALKVSGLPPKLQGWSFDHVSIQRQGQRNDDFLEQLPSGHIGIFRDNGPAFASVNQWQGESLYLHGPVGRGKSTLVAALVNRLAMPPLARERPYTDEELLRKYRCTDIEDVPITARKYHRKGIAAPAMGRVLYVDESEMQARVKLSWSGDKDPLLKLTKQPILVIDDLGKGKLSGKGGDWWSEALERLVCYRYDHELPLIITSNKPWDEIGDYGARTESRLREMVGGGHFRVYGPDWRTL